MHPQSYWDGFAQSYARLGPPLRPTTGDIEFLEKTVADYARTNGMQRLDALLLGVTPDIVCMRWPDVTSLVAVDSSLPMARAVWPGNVAGIRNVVCGDWLSLPRRPSSCDVVIGDGSINCLRYPGGFDDFAAAVSSVLRPNGVLILRVYLQAVPRESADDVLSDAGSISSFHALKLRLLMAMQKTAFDGVAVNDVYRWWRERNIDLRLLPNADGWAKTDIGTIEFYRGSSSIYSFPTLSELRSQLLEFFDEVSISVPPHDMGERCPVLVLKPCRKATRQI
jgi:SAM-dependent methyltransferase